MLDGKFTSANNYSGPIGKKMEVNDLHEMVIVDFEHIINQNLLVMIEAIAEWLKKKFFLWY